MSYLEDDINEPVDMVDESTDTVVEVEEETKDEAQTEESDVTESVATEEVAEEEAESEEGSEAEAEEESDDEATKAHNAEMAQRRIAEREARRQQEAALLQAQRQYVEEAESDAQRLVNELHIERYNQTVKANEQAILTEYERVKADPALQIFNPDSKEFKTDLFNELSETFEKAHTQVDEWGNVVAVNASFYDKAKQWGNMWNRQAKISEAKASSNLKKTASKVEPQSNSAPRPTKTKDPLMDLLTSDD
jgi:hypothetical protein